MTTNTRSWNITESGVFFILAVVFLVWREPGTPLALHLLSPLGAALCAIEPLLSRRICARKRTAITVAGLAALLSSGFYEVFVTPGLAQWVRLMLTILMLALVVFTPKRHDP